MANTTTRIDTPAAILWASAFLLAALVIITAGRLPANQAYAEMAVSGTNGFTLMTADAGRGGDENPDELLYVIDNRSEMLFVYEVLNAQTGGLNLKGGGSLTELFQTAARR